MFRAQASSTSRSSSDSANCSELSVRRISPCSASRSSSPTRLRELDALIAAREPGGSLRHDSPDRSPSRPDERTPIRRCHPSRPTACAETAGIRSRTRHPVSRAPIPRRHRRVLQHAERQHDVPASRRPAAGLVDTERHPTPCSTSSHSPSSCPTRAHEYPLTRHRGLCHPCTRCRA